METYLAHYGVLGQRWGVRRFQNEDGSLTADGRERYGMSSERLTTRSKMQAARSRAYDRYERTENSIESGYKRGQKLSDTDYKRERENEKAYRDEDKRIKETAKQDRKVAQQVWKDQRKEYIDVNSNFPKEAVKFLVMGPFGEYTYNSLRATDHSRLVSFGATTASSLLAGPIGNMILASYIADETKKKY